MIDDTSVARTNGLSLELNIRILGFSLTPDTAQGKSRITLHTCEKELITNEGTVQHTKKNPPVYIILKFKMGGVAETKRSPMSMRLGNTINSVIIYTLKF